MFTKSKYTNNSRIVHSLRRNQGNLWECQRFRLVNRLRWYGNSVCQYIYIRSLLCKRTCGKVECTTIQLDTFKFDCCILFECCDRNEKLFSYVTMERAFYKNNTETSKSMQWIYLCVYENDTLDATVSFILMKQMEKCYALCWKNTNPPLKHCYNTSYMYEYMDI